jgi:hypothetical protein
MRPGEPAGYFRLKTDNFSDQPRRHPSIEDGYWPELRLFR